MSITHVCSRCRKTFTLADQLAGKKARCDSCGNVERLTDAAEVYPLLPQAARISAMTLNGRELTGNDFLASPNGRGATEEHSHGDSGNESASLVGRAGSDCRRDRRGESRITSPLVRSRIVGLLTVLARPWRHYQRSAISSSSIVQQESLAFLVLSTADLLITHALLRQGSSYYESNPIAHWFFARWNIAGMTVLKFSVIAFVIIIAEIVERHRPRLGKTLLSLACLLTAAVVAYGLKLLLASGGVWTV